MPECLELLERRVALIEDTQRVALELPDGLASGSLVLIRAERHLGRTPPVFMYQRMLNEARQQLEALK